MKELRVLPYKTIQLRIKQLLINIINSPSKTWANRVKTFSYNYVYRSCRKTLATTYLSTKS